MRGLMLAAALLAVVLAAVHGIGGEITNLRALARGDASDGDKLELRAVWHLYTWHLALTGALLLALWGGLVPANALLRWFLVASFAGGGAIFLAIAARRGVRAVISHPQWLLLSAVGGLAYWAVRSGG